MRYDLRVENLRFTTRLEKTRKKGLVTSAAQRASVKRLFWRENYRFFKIFVIFAFERANLNEKRTSAVVVPLITFSVVFNRSFLFQSFEICSVVITT
jgi:hypothetical protein